MLECLTPPLVALTLCSPKPTLEEVRSWGQSFDKLMCCPAGRNSFRQFLRTEFSEENMLFWLACDEFRQETNKSVIEEKARVIYEDYISILSPKEVWQLPISPYYESMLWFEGSWYQIHLIFSNTKWTVRCFSEMLLLAFYRWITAHKLK